MTVFIVHPLDKIDVEKSAQWGQPYYINDRYVTADRLEGEDLPREFHRHLARAARDFRKETDFLLIAGDHLQIVAFSALLSIKCQYFRVLRWDRQAEGYYPVRITFPVF